MPPRRPAPRDLAILVASAILGGTTCWRLHEDDIFWQLRAGREIVVTHAVQTADTWSYTVSGQPWVNYQWLSDVVFYMVHAVGGVPALIGLRVCLVSLWFFLIMHLMAVVSSLWAAAAVVPFLFVAVQFRLHVRPEMFGLILFTATLLLWFNGKELSERGARLRDFGTIAMLFLSANFHAGTAVFGLFLALGLFTFIKPSWSARGPWLIASLAAFFATPVHAKIVGELYKHATYDNSILSNTEWLPVNHSLFSLPREGLTFFVWAGVAVVGCLGAILQLARPSTISGLYRRSTLVALLVGPFTVMAFTRIRFIPYQVIVLAPIVGALAFRSRVVLTLIALSGWGVVLPSQVVRYRDLYGLTINEDLFSPRLLAFIEVHRPLGRLFTTFEVGSLQNWLLPEYPVFADPRDKIFDSVKTEYVRAFEDPSALADLVRRYDVSLVLLDYPEAMTGPDGRFANPIDTFLPPSEWALVAFDRKRALFLKRRAGNDELISRYECLYVTPRAPPTTYAFRKDLDSAAAARFAAELSRCLDQDPANTYCQLVEAARDLAAPDEASWQRAKRSLAALWEIEQRRPASSQRFHLFVLLARAYEKCGEPERAPSLDETGERVR